ncbi:MAG: polysaccharide deacetylase family protein, partial [Flavisolibacter sp.]
AFFKAEGDTGFDLFAAIFYLVTRYEEYLPHGKDSYDRFAHEDSVAFKNNFLHLPLVNIWLEDFRLLLAERNQEFKNLDSHFSFLPTYDIDMAWSFRNKGFKRNAGGVLLLLFKLKLRKLSKRLKVLRGKIQDPYDAYDWMDELHANFALEPIYFFLLAKEKTRHDKNISVANPEFQKLIRDLAAKYTTGLHPSWASGNLPSLLTKEKHLLEQITGKPVAHSRQHFIRFQLPVTYQQLLGLGIKNDYSMGYGSINGFRASISTPYYWYDLKHEEKTDLLLHPFCFMDANAYYEQHLSAGQALNELMQYYSVIRSVNGRMITIWHNSFLGTDSSFEGWREAYEEFISRISSNRKDKFLTTEKGEREGLSQRDNSKAKK